MYNTQYIIAIFFPEGGRRVSFVRQDSVNSNSNAGSEFDDERKCAL